MNPIDIDNLLEVSKLRKEIKNKFTTKRMNDQGLEEDLTKVYKPLTESQTKNTTDIVNHLSNLSNTNNKQIIDFKDTFKNFPELVGAIDEIKSLLDIKTTEIINKIKTNDPAVIREIKELDDEQEQFGDALDEIMSEADTGIDTMITDKSLGAISKMSRGQASGASSKIPRGHAFGVEKARQFVEEQTVRKELDNERAHAEAATIMINQAILKNNVDWLNDALTSPRMQGNLMKYIEFNPHANLNINPWKKIKELNPPLYEEFKRIKKEKTGRGLSCGCKSVKFLPDNKKDLSHELIRLMGSYKSGNKAVFNELNAVVDELRRKGILTLKQSKKIYQTIKQ